MAKSILFLEDGLLLNLLKKCFEVEAELVVNCLVKPFLDVGATMFG